MNVEIPETYQCQECELPTLRAERLCFFCDAKRHGDLDAVERAESINVSPSVPLMVGDWVMLAERRIVGKLTVIRPNGMGVVLSTSGHVYEAPLQDWVLALS